MSVNCPECGYPQSKVMDSRAGRRKRICCDCASIWYTMEIDESIYQRVLYLVEHEQEIQESISRISFYLSVSRE